MLEDGVAGGCDEEFGMVAVAGEAGVPVGPAAEVVSDIMTGEGGGGTC